MRKILLLCGLVLIVLSGVAYTAKTQEDPGFNFPPHDAPPQARIEFYEKEILKCKDYLDELSIGINKANILFGDAQDKNPHLFSGFNWSGQIYRFELDVRLVCNRIKLHQDNIRDEMDKLPPAPTPTPTPGPSPGPSPPKTETKSDESSDPLKNKQLRDRDAEIKFINEYRAKLNDVKAGVNKIFKDINDYVKKARPQTIYKVVINHEEQYSIWPADRENALGWDDVGKTGTKEECLAYIKEVVANPVIPGPGKISIPSQAQNGRNLELTGPFDGNATTTAVTIEGQRVEVLEEAAGKCVVKIPSNLTGPVKVTVEEGGQKAEGTCRIISVDVTATKTNLMKGEQAVVTVTVTGLDGIKQTIPLHLTTKGVINIEGGNAQLLRIHPSDVKGGRYTITRQITGRQAGGFDVTATVITKPWETKLGEGLRENGYRLKRDGNSFLLFIENAKDPLTGDPLNGESVLETECAPGSKIKSLSPVLVKKGQAQLKNPFSGDSFICPDVGYQIPRTYRFSLGLRF